MNWTSVYQEKNDFYSLIENDFLNDEKKKDDLEIKEGFLKNLKKKVKSRKKPLISLGKKIAQPVEVAAKTIAKPAEVVAKTIIKPVKVLHDIYEEEVPDEIKDTVEAATVLSGVGLTYDLVANDGKNTRKLITQTKKGAVASKEIAVKSASATKKMASKSANATANFFKKGGVFLRNIAIGVVAFLVLILLIKIL